MLGAGLFYRITIKRLHGVLKLHLTFKFQITLPISSCLCYRSAGRLLLGSKYTNWCYWTS